MVERFYNKPSIILNFVLLVLCIKFYCEKKTLSYYILYENCISEKLEPKGELDTTPTVRLFNLHSKLEPRSVYSGIDCRRSSTYIVSTTLCVHNIDEDIHVSGSIWRDGAWEPHILRPFNHYVNNNPDWLVLDIGAQIGQYTLFAAKLGRDVVCVEPFYENILRIHKAAVTENLADRITLITNALSNRRNEIKLLQKSQNNIGGQSLLNSRNKKYSRSDMRTNKYLVETILFDDIVKFIPKVNRFTNKTYTKGILKIDIEGFEPYAFQFSKKLFKLIDIQIVFMEWGNFARENFMDNQIREMMNFLYSNNLIPYADDSIGNRVELDRKNWKNWPWDVIWSKVNKQ